MPQSDVRDKRKQIHGYVNANARLTAELEKRDSQIAELSQRQLPMSLPSTPSKGGLPGL